MPNYWVLKTEPTAYSYEMLVRTAAPIGME